MPDRGTVWALARPAGLAGAGFALVCWGLALGGYWPVALALYGQRALPTAGVTLALGMLLAAASGALLATALVTALVTALRVVRVVHRPARKGVP
jgi:hypothetical protein